jgi:hypothetical protein
MSRRSSGGEAQVCLTYDILCIYSIWFKLHAVQYPTLSYRNGHIRATEQAEACIVAYKEELDDYLPALE